MVYQVKRRTNLNLEGNIVDFLHSHDKNCSTIADKALRTHAEELGYSNLREQIKYHEHRLKALRKQISNKAAYDAQEEKFCIALLGYLSTKDPSASTMQSIKAWLTGPANREYSDFIGHARHLTDEKIQSLIVRAHTYKDGTKMEE